MRASRTISLAMALATLLSPRLARAADVEGSRDHPLVSRIPGSEIRQYEQAKFGQVVLPVGKATGKGKFADQVTSEGKVTRVAYRLPADRSPLEAYRQYRAALTTAGFELLWSCERQSACGNWFAQNFNGLPGEKRVFGGEAIAEKEEYYLAARLRRPEGDVVVQVLAYPTVPRGTGYARVRVVETRPMEAGLVTVDADAMKRDIERTGRVAIYGITFDTDSATIAPESNATLDEMAKLLKGSGGLSVFIVGHTDGTGSFDHNLGLSRRRAAAVVEALVQRGIAQTRLAAHGVGPLAPVGSNETDEGRGRNRRVEMVRR